MSLSFTGIAAALIDFAIIVASILVFGFLYARRKTKSDIASRGVRFLILGGLGLIVGLHAADVALTLMWPSKFDVGEPHVHSAAVPLWLDWLVSRVAFCMMAVGVVLTVLERRRVDEAMQTSRELVREARDRIIRSEARFRFLVDTTSNSVYCYSFDPPMPVSLPVEAQVRRSHRAILTECNQVFAGTLDADNPADVIGSRMGMLDANKDTRAYHEFFKAFIDSGYRLSDYEMIYQTPEGYDRALRVSLTGIVKNGLLHRMWGAESNILDLRQTKAALAVRHHFQELLATISSALVKAKNDDADDVMNECLQKVCRFSKADRATISWVDHDQHVANVEYRWRNVNRPLTSVVSMSDFPAMSRLVLGGDEIRIGDTRKLGGEFDTDRKSLASLEIRSVAVLPMKVGDEVVGVATFANTNEVHDWSNQEMMDLRVFAELFANYMLRLKSRRALDEALQGLRVASERLEAENVYLRQEIDLTKGFEEIIGESDELLRCLLAVDRVAVTTAPVLLLGETGTGKELLARAIHEHSNRSDRPLVKVNCAALPANLIESELFGYEKGAFTGADKAKRGRFDLAHESTLFLDEIGDIPLELQPKLLRVLQEGEFERLGGSGTVKVDVRIIAATNRDLQDAAQKGEFRSDLFYRINTFPIKVPPLRARDGDIQLLAEHFVKVHSERLGREVTAMSARMMHQLLEYSWPGNVRELEGVIQRAIISSSGPVLELADALQTKPAAFDDSMPRILTTSIADLKLVEKEHILSVLEESGWKISGTDGAASRLGIPPSTLRSKMKKLSIERPA